MFSIRCNSPIKLWRIGKHSERIKKSNFFINRYNWEGINFPSEIDDGKKIEKNNLIIALNVSYTKKEKIYPAC